MLLLLPLFRTGCGNSVRNGRSGRTLDHRSPIATKCIARLTFFLSLCVLYPKFSMVSFNDLIAKQRVYTTGRRCYYLILLCSKSLLDFPYHCVHGLFSGAIFDCSLAARTISIVEASAFHQRKSKTLPCSIYIDHAVRTFTQQNESS